MGVVLPAPRELRDRRVLDLRDVACRAAAAAAAATLLVSGKHTKNGHEGCETAMQDDCTRNGRRLQKRLTAQHWYE